jgi:hypothetical protein
LFYYHLVSMPTSREQQQSVIALLYDTIVNVSLNDVTSSLRRHLTFHAISVLLLTYMNVLKLTSFNLVLRTTIMVKPQISKFQAEKCCQVGFNVLQHIYTQSFIKRVKSSVQKLRSTCFRGWSPWVLLPKYFLVS